MKVEIELNAAEERYITSCCIQRVINSVLDALPANYGYVEDVEELAIMERIRVRLLHAVFEKRMNMVLKGEKL